MSQNSKDSKDFENEIDLIEVTKTLIRNKKIIILSAIICTLASIFYSLTLKTTFQSSNIIEIGYFENNKGYQELIETPTSLVSNLKVNLFFKDTKDTLLKQVKVKVLEDKLIRLSFSSDSAELNEKVFKNFFSYIDERHSRIAKSISDEKRDNILEKIESIKSKKRTTLQNIKTKTTEELEGVDLEISYIKSELLKKKETDISDLKSQGFVIKNQLGYTNQKINKIKELLKNITENLKLSESDNQLIYDKYFYENQLIDLELNKYSFLEKIANIDNKLERIQIIENTPERLFKLQREQGKLNKQLELIKTNKFDSKSLLELEKKQDGLEQQLEVLLNKKYIPTSFSGKIKTEITEHKTLLYILLGFVFGLFAGVFIVLIRSFYKNLLKTY